MRTKSFIAIALCIAIGLASFIPSRRTELDTQINVDNESRLLQRGWPIPLSFGQNPSTLTPKFPDKAFGQEPVKLIFSEHKETNIKIHAQFSIRVGVLQKQGFKEDKEVALAIARDFRDYVETRYDIETGGNFLLGFFSGFDKPIAVMGIEMTNIEGAMPQDPRIMISWAQTYLEHRSIGPIQEQLVGDAQSELPGEPPVIRAQLMP